MRRHNLGKPKGNHRNAAAMPLVKETKKTSGAPDRALTAKGVRAKPPQTTQKEAAPVAQWPAHFFEETYGCLENDPLERLPQGNLPPLTL